MRYEGNLIKLYHNRVSQNMCYLFWECRYHLKDAVVEGGVPFDEAHGINAFEYPKKDNGFNQVFNKAMYDNTRIVMKLILEKV